MAVEDKAVYAPIESIRYDFMETVMNGIEKRAGYYRGYLTDDRSLIPLTIVLGITVALWLLVYLLGSLGPPYKPQMGLLPPHASPSVALHTRS